MLQTSSNSPSLGERIPDPLESKLEMGGWAAGWGGAGLHLKVKMLQGIPLSSTSAAVPLVLFLLLFFIIIISEGLVKACV